MKNTKVFKVSKKKGYQREIVKPIHHGLYFSCHAIFDLTKKYSANPYEKKVNLGQGTYRDENCSPFVLPAVKEAKKRLASQNHEYLPILGLPELRKLATELVLRSDSSALTEQKVASYQSLSGTGALHLAGLFLKRFSTTKPRVFVTEPAWSNHHQVFQTIGFETQAYTYFDSESKSLDFESVRKGLLAAPEGSIFVLHACAHNPSGCDPTREQWRNTADIMKERNLFPIFDSAYLGMNSGDYEADAFAIRYFIDEMKMEAAICLSLAKNMGLYGERVGCVAFVTQTSQQSKNVESVLETLQSEVSNPPAFGARIASTILADESLKKTWLLDLKDISQRIAQMRKELMQHLSKLETPGNWQHVTSQTGMFCILGLTPSQVSHLQKIHHIYMASNSRISIAGINMGNVEYVANAINETIRNR
ncbi:aromatic-amino-acid aminotransferase [Halenospora varia]|nr:aromatic-amino-acid aminotransferase [Halenospora varia]